MRSLANGFGNGIYWMIAIALILSAGPALAWIGLALVAAMVICARRRPTDPRSVGRRAPKRVPR